jgi:hypothetical protein
LFQLKGERDEGFGKKKKKRSSCQSRYQKLFLPRLKRKVAEKEK